MSTAHQRERDPDTVERSVPTGRDGRSIDRTRLRAAVLRELPDALRDAVPARRPVTAADVGDAEPRPAPSRAA